MPKARVRILGSVGRAIQTGGTIIKELGSGEITLAQLKEALGLSGLGAPGQTGQPARPVVTTTAEPAAGRTSTQTPAVHIPSMRRPAAMRGTIDSLLEGNDFWRTPSSHFDNLANRNWNLGKTIDDSGSLRYAVSYVDGNRRALVDLSSAHLNKNLSNIADDATSQRYAVLAVDGNRRALVDFGQSGHINRQSLLNTSKWVIHSSGSQGNFLDNANSTYVLPSKMFIGGEGGGVPVGPYGKSEPIWVAYGAATSCADGGWNNYGDLQNIDPTKTYMFTVWVCRVMNTTTGTIYFGCDGGNTDDLSGAADNNPYFTQFSSTTMTINQWYLIVGIVHGSGYSGSDSGLSGVWDPATGTRTTAGTDFKMKAGATQQTHRTYFFYDTGGTNLSTSTWVAFARPGVFLCDGSEPTIQTLLANTTDGLRDGATYLRMPTPPASSATGNTTLSQSGTTTTINVSAGTFYLGNVTLNFNSGSVNPGSYGKWYVYFDSPNYAGGAVTFQVSSTPLSTTQSPWRFYVGTITTASGGGGGGGSGGGGGCCLHESQMIELADGREIPARELTTDMVLLSHEGPVAITELRFLPHREWYKVRLDTGVELFVAGDHRFLDDDFNQLRTWDLKLGQRVRARNGYAIVTGLDVLWTEATKVAIEVAEPHTYYVQGVLSHNKMLC